MQTLKQFVKECCIKSIETLYQKSFSNLEISTTRTEFTGHYTLVIFPLVKELKKNPETLANEIGIYLKENHTDIQSFNVVKGFLNIELSSTLLSNYLLHNYSKPDFGKLDKNSKKIMVEYSSPNTNKPLHLGHIRNNLLGFSISSILDFAGYEVLKTQIINDRGIHICKSMLAWMKFGNGETPTSNSTKGDHLVGKYYVAFDQEYQKQIADLVEQGLPKEQAKKEAPILIEAQEFC